MKYHEGLKVPPTTLATPAELAQSIACTNADCTIKGCVECVYWHENLAAFERMMKEATQ